MVDKERKNKYWRDREEEALKHYVRDEAEYDKRINQIYSDMLDGIQNEINGFYGKYADNEGISLSEAKKRVSKLDIKAYERKAARYVRDASLDRKVNAGKTNKGGYYFGEKANEEMRLYNLTMKVNRLEMLKANIGLEMIKGHAELEAFMDEILQGRTMEELERQAGILGKSIRSNAKAANALVNSSFHSATFSDRVWMYHDMMKADLALLLQTGLIQGKNARELARDIKKYVNPDAKGGARYNAERLMRTELARVQTEAQMQSFERNGFSMYTFITNSGCCPKCQALNGKHFSVEDHEIALNAPPLHPHCRCSTAAYEDSDEFDAWLDYLADGGTTESWEAAKKGLEKSGKSGTIKSGARITDPESEEGKAFAKSFYPEIRKRKTDCKSVAKNTGKDVAAIEKIKNYLFVDASLYDEDLGVWRRFDEDCAIAQSWQRLTDGNDIKQHDRILIEHELYEIELKRENPEMSHDEAHSAAQEKYNYKEAVIKYYDNLKKSQKNGKSDNG